MSPLIWLALLSVVLFALAGQYIAESKGRSPNEGAAMGLLLGPLGLLIAVLMPTRTNGGSSTTVFAVVVGQSEPRPEPTLGRLRPTPRDDHLAESLLESALRREAESESRAIRRD